MNGLAGRPLFYSPKLFESGAAGGVEGILPGTAPGSRILESGNGIGGGAMFGGGAKLGGLKFGGGISGGIIFGGMPDGGFTGGPGGGGAPSGGKGSGIGGAPMSPGGLMSGGKARIASGLAAIGGNGSASAATANTSITPKTAAPNIL